MDDGVPGLGKGLLLLGLVLGLSAPVPGFSADWAASSNLHYYLQGGLGVSRQTSPANGGQLDLSGHGEATAFDLGGGVQFTPRWGAQINYVGLGSVSIATPSGSDRYVTRLVALTATFSQPVSESWTLFGRAGLAWSYSSSDIDSLGYHGTSRKTPLVVGLGARYPLTPKLSIVGHYDYYGHTGGYASGGSITGAMLGAGLQWFLN